MICRFQIRPCIDAHEKYMDAISAYTTLKVMLDDELERDGGDDELITSMRKAMKKIDKVVDAKRQVYEEAVKAFEKEFIKDVLDHPDYYRRRISKED